MSRLWRRVDAAASRGQGLVEFALVLPLVMFLIFGVLDFGRAVYTYNTVSQAARSAGRKALVDQNRTDVRNAAIAAAADAGPEEQQRGGLLQGAGHARA